VSITTPTSNPTHSVTSTPLSIGGTASDNVGVTQVTWVNDRGGSGVGVGTSSWSVNNISLQPGQNTITVSAHDASGNSASAIISVSYTAGTLIYTNRLQSVTDMMTLTSSNGQAHSRRARRKCPVRVLGLDDLGAAAAWPAR
jgi:hypothetical protein